VKRFYNHTLTKIMRGSSEKVTQKVKIWKLFLMALLRNSRNSLIKNIAVSGASSEDSLPSGRFQHWKSLLDRRNETQRTTKGVKIFSGVVTDALWSYKNPRTRVAPRLLQLRYYCPQGSEETSGELRYISCYRHALIVQPRQQCAGLQLENWRHRAVCTSSMWCTVMWCACCNARLDRARMCTICKFKICRALWLKPLTKLETCSR
jgi:hypothetical protein